MQYLSTRNSSLKESFATILFQGLSKDGGLFLPHTWPSIDIEQLKNQSYQEISFHVIFPFVRENIREGDLKLILDKTFNGNIENLMNANIESLLSIHGVKLLPWGSVVGCPSIQAGSFAH